VEDKRLKKAIEDKMAKRGQNNYNFAVLD